jgi:dihydroorotase
MADLILRGGRIVDPANARDEVADIAFSGGKVAAVGADLGRDGAEIVDVRGLIVAPGLIDLHTHVYWGGTSLGVDAGEVARNMRSARASWSERPPICGSSIPVSAYASSTRTAT